MEKRRNEYTSWERRRRLVRTLSMDVTGGASSDWMLRKAEVCIATSGSEENKFTSVRHPSKYTCHKTNVLSRSMSSGCARAYFARCTHFLHGIARVSKSVCWLPGNVAMQYNNQSDRWELRPRRLRKSYELLSSYQSLYAPNRRRCSNSQDCPTNEEVT